MVANIYSINPYCVILKFMMVTLAQVSGKNYGLFNPEIKKSLNFGEYGIILSPIVIDKEPPCFVTFCYSTGSNTTSSTSVQSSTISHFPACIQISKFLIKLTFLVLENSTPSSLDFAKFFKNLRAYF